MTDYKNQSFDMTVKVLQKHIDEGVQAKCDKCPVTLAVRDEFNARRISTVHILTMAHVIISDFHQAVLPVEVGNWVALFDLAGVGRPDLLFKLRFHYVEGLSAKRHLEYVYENEDLHCTPQPPSGN